MTKFVATTLGLVVSMTVGAGLARAHDKAPEPSLISETMDTLRDPGVGSQANPGVDAELEGTLEILHEDREDGSSRYRHSLLTHDGKRLSLEGVQHPDLLTGDRVRVRGIKSGQTLQLRTTSTQNLEVVQYAPLSNTFGSQKTVVLLVNFSNDSSRPATISSVQLAMAKSDAFFRENSYGQTSLSVDVFGWYTLPIANTGCPDQSIKTYANQAASAAGINLSAYTRRVYLYPSIPSCGFAGMGTVGGTPSSMWINGAGNLWSFNHEFGHNLGLLHSHSISCAPAVLGPTCTTQDYGDGLDTMGGGIGHFNAFQKQRLGWLGYGASPPITSVQSTGMYSIDAYEVPGTAPKALKIPRGPASAQAFFFVELRTTAGFDFFLPSIGVFVRLGNDGNGNTSYLLDMTPETQFDWDYEFLAVGQSFTDPVSGVTIQTISASSTSATVMVDIGGTGPLCTRSAPRVTATPGQSPAVQSGTAVMYTVSITNTDSAGCSAASFTLQATAPSGWQKSFGASSVTTTPGATVSTTLQITSPAVPTGAYTIVSAATSTTASPLSGSASMLYNVAPNGPPVPPGAMFTDTFDRPDSAMLGNGWSVTAGGLLIQAGEARNQATSTFSLAVQPALTGATQTVAASFASTNNNAGPRFGVVVRYRDPQNYYICYRQTGGASILRIAKVQNGAETVLKSVAIGNPALNAFSKLACQASGTTLTLQVDGVTKASTSDGTFTTGSAGYAISTKGGSHRADNYSAIVQ